MPINVSSLQSVIEVNIAPAISALQQYDTAQKQTAVNAKQSGDALKQAFTGATSPIQAASKEAQGLGVRIRELATNAKEFSAGFISGGVAEMRDFFKEAGDAAKKSGDDIAAGAEKARKGLGDSTKATGDNAKQIQALGNQVRSASEAIAAVGKGDLSKLPGLVQSFASSLSTASGEAGTLASSLGPMAIGVGAVVGAAAGLTAVSGLMFNLAKEGSDLGGKMLDLSTNTGIAADSLAVYKIAAEQSASSVEAVANGISIFEKRIQESASGSKELSKVFRALGVDAKQAALDPQTAFEGLAEKIASIEDPLLRTKVATEIFGRSGANLISTFVTMKTDGEALKQRMDELGLVLGNNVVAGADRLGDELVVLQATSDALKIKMANEMGPALVDAVQSVERSLVAVTPIVIAVGDHFATSFSKGVSWAEKLSQKIDDVAGSPGLAKLLAIGTLQTFGIIGAEGNKSAQRRIENGIEHGWEVPSAGFKVANGYGALTKDYGNAVEVDPNTGQPLDPSKKLGPLNRYDALRNSLNKSGKSGGGANTPVTPTDTFSSTKQLRDAELSLEETYAKTSISIAKAEADEKKKLLDAGYADNLVTISGYYEQRRKIESEAIDREIAEQKTIIEFEKKRSDAAEEDTRKEIERINRLEDAQRKKAKTPAQKAAIEEDRGAKITNAENQLEVERDKHLQKQVEAEGKITELQSKRAGQIASTSRDEVKANKALESTFQDLIDKAKEATSDGLTDAGTTAGKTFADSLALAIREGRTDVQAAIKTLTAVEANRKAIESSEKRQSVLQSGLDLAQVRIQAEYNEGLISEVTARRENIAAQAKFRDQIVEELEIQKKRAEAISDYVTAARLEVEIEKKKREGRELDPHVKSLGDNLTRDFDQLQADLESGQKKLSEALRDFGRSFVTDILHEVQSSIVENLTHEKSIGAALGKGIAKKLGGLFNIGKEPNAPGGVDDPTKPIVDKLAENKDKLAQDIASLSGKTTDAIKIAAARQSEVLEKIAVSNADMANCACAPAQGPRLLGTILGAVVGAVGAGLGASIGGGGGGRGGGSPGGLVLEGDPGWIPEPGLARGGLVAARYMRDGGPVFPYDAGGMCDGGHVGTRAGYAAMGRFIEGPGTGRSDSIPMWLSDGEYVNDAETVKALGPNFFKALPMFAKAGKMADGGIVGYQNTGPMPTRTASSGPSKDPASAGQGRKGSTSGGVTIIQNFTIQAPQGSITPQTQRQIAAQSGQAIQAALNRNT